MPPKADQKQVKPATVEKKSVQVQPTYEELPRSDLTFVFQIASIAESMVQFGQDPRLRDLQLRAFWPTEPLLASAVYNIVSRNASFKWELDGPPRTVKAVQEMFQNANFGKGWTDFITKLQVDLFTQDNGAFFEIIRSGPGRDSVPISFAHLDAGACRRTGVHDWPVIYTDRYGAEHKLKPWQVVSIEEFPSPIEKMNGIQLCAVSRVLRAAQLLRDVGIYKREKLSGNTPTSIHLVGGINEKELTDSLQQHGQHQMQQQYMRYIKPLIFAPVDPTVDVSHVELKLKSLPDNFDEETTLKWYISQLAMGFGADYQEFAPLPGGNMGTSSQSMVQHMKARGKGPALFMQLITQTLNYRNIIPRNVLFRYDEQDPAADMEKWDVLKKKADTYKVYLDGGVYTPEAVLQMQLDDGDISQEIFDMITQGAPDVTPDTTGHQDEPVKEIKAEEVRDDQRPSFQEDLTITWESWLAEEIDKAQAASFKDLKKIIQKNVKELGRKTPEEALDDPNWWQDYRLKMTKPAGQAYKNASLDAALSNTLIGLNINMSLVNRQVLDTTKIYTDAWWESVSATTRKELRNAMVRWQSQGLGKRGLPDLIKSLEPTFGRVRAERIAVTETTRIFDTGNRIAQDSAGIQYQEWMTVGDDLVCPICSPLNKVQFPINQGPRPPGDTHVNCRCMRLPVGKNLRAMGKTDKRMKPLVKRPPGKPASAKQALAPKTVKQKVRAAEKELMTKFKKDGKEHGCIVNEFGDIVFRRDGGKHQVTWPANMCEYLRNRPGAMLIHNHPGSGSFSLADVRFAMYNRVKDMVVVSSKYRYTMVIPDKYWNYSLSQLQTVGISYNSTLNGLRKKYQTAIANGKMTTDKATQEWSHQGLTSFCKRHDIPYKREKM